MRLAESAWTDADGAGTDLALVPVGSTEQHGPHAPLATDTLTAEAVANAAAAAYPAEVVVAPAIPYGVSEEHRRFAGTCWLRPDTFRAAVADVVRSLLGHGWRRVLLVNGHGGNEAALREVAARLTRDERAIVAAFTWWSVADATTMGHAGPVETSMLRFHHPGLVHEDRIEAAAAGAAEGWGDRVEGVDLAYDTDVFTENGVVGDPTDADAGTGEALTDRAAAAIGTLLDALAERSLD